LIQVLTKPCSADLHNSILIRYVRIVQ
jgi:hypothetical protein